VGLFLWRKKTAFENAAEKARKCPERFCSKTQQKFSEYGFCRPFLNKILKFYFAMQQLNAIFHQKSRIELKKVECNKVTA